MQNSNTFQNSKTLDTIVLAAIFLLALILILNFAKLPIVGNDVWFHLTMAKQTLAQKSLPLFDTWSFQPSVRPNLYSPLYHLLLAGVTALFKLSTTISAAKFLAAIFYPTSLLGIWFLARKMIGPKTAFFAFFISLLDIILANPHFEMTPSSLFLVIMPFAIYFFYKKNLVATACLVLIALYFHMTAPLCLIFGFYIFSANFKKEYFKFWVKTTTYSLILFLPWVIWTLYNFKFFNGYNYIYRMINGGISGVAFLSQHTISLVILVFCIGAYIFLGHLIRHKQNMFMLAAMPIAFLPVLFAAGGRYWWYAEPFLVILFGYLIAWKTKQIKPIIALILIAATFLLWLPVVTIDFTNNENTIDWGRSQAGFVKAIQITKLQTTNYSLQTTISNELIDFIKTNASRDEIISVSDGKLAMQITFLTDRKTNSGMFGEVLTQQAFENQFNPFANRIIVCEKQKCPTQPHCQLGHYEIKAFGEYEVWIRK